MQRKDIPEILPFFQCKVGACWKTPVMVKLRYLWSKKKCLSSLLVWVVCLYLPADYISRSHHPSPQQLVEKRKKLGICMFFCFFFEKKNKMSWCCNTESCISIDFVQIIKTNFKKVIWLWWKYNSTVGLRATSHSNSPICVAAWSRNDIAKFLKCETWQTRAALDSLSTRLLNCASLQVQITFRSSQSVWGSAITKALRVLFPHCQLLFR